MERLDKIVEKHEERIGALELEGIKRNHQMELLVLKVEGMGNQFTDLKTAVKEDGAKTRDSIEKSQEKADKQNDWMRTRIEALDSYEEAAAVREHETVKERETTKRTKLQIVRDVTLAVVGSSLVLQEIIQWSQQLFK